MGIFELGELFLQLLPSLINVDLLELEFLPGGLLFF
jgi:hypothetical protein